MPWRNLLGYRRVGNGWISPREIADVAERTAWKQRSIQRYGKRIAKLVNRMNSPAASVRDRAIDELMELTDADAIGAVEAGLASPSAPPSMLAIDWMSRIDDVESSRVLARYSLMHPAESVRQSARGRLVDRPLFDFVPEMLGMLSSPVSMTIVPSFDQRGALVGYRQAFRAKILTARNSSKLTAILSGRQRRCHRWRRPRRPLEAIPFRPLLFQEGFHPPRPGWNS